MSIDQKAERDVVQTDTGPGEGLPDGIPDFLKRSPPANGMLPMATKYVADEEVETASEDEAPSRPAGKRKVKARAKPTVKAKPASKHAKGNGRAVSTKPRAKRQRDPAGLDSFGLRLKSIKSRAAAMYARKAGATLAQVKAEVGSVQFNVIKELEDKGFKFKRVTEDSGTHGRKATRYFLQHK